MRMNFYGDHLMVDLETMGTGAKAAILSIGAVHFSVNEKMEIAEGGTFYEEINLQSCMDAGLEVDADTIIWWLQQDPAAQKAFAQNAAALTLPTALSNFTSFCKTIEGDVQVWGNGASFDNSILASAYRAVNLKSPWPFWNDRCFRTMKSHFKVVAPPFEGTAHNALADAIHQAHHLILIILSLLGKDESNAS